MQIHSPTTTPAHTAPTASAPPVPIASGSPRRRLHKLQAEPHLIVNRLARINDVIQPAYLRVRFAHLGDLRAPRHRTALAVRQTGCSAGTALAAAPSSGSAAGWTNPGWRRSNVRNRPGRFCRSMKPYSVRRVGERLGEDVHRFAADLQVEIAAGRQQCVAQRFEVEPAAVGAGEQAIVGVDRCGLAGSRRSTADRSATRQSACAAS